MASNGGSQGWSRKARHVGDSDGYVVGLPTLRLALPDVHLRTTGVTPRATLTLLCCQTSKVTEGPHLRWRQRNLALRLVLVKTQIARRGWEDPCKSVGFLFSPTAPLPLRPAKLKHTAITAGTLHNFMTPSNIPCQQCASSTKWADSWAGRRAETLCKSTLDAFQQPRKLCMQVASCSGPTVL